MQKALLESFIPIKPALSSQAHECYLQLKLINIMEDEMDVSTRTTRRGFNDMTEAERNAHFTSTKAMHKVTWEAAQKKDNSGGIDVEASFAAFQEVETKQAQRSDTSTRGRF